MTLDVNYNYHNTKCYTLAKKRDVLEENKFWLAILNSKLLWFFLSSTGYVLRGGFFTFKTKYLEPFPLPQIKNLEQQTPFVENVDIMLFLTSKLQEGLEKFQRTLQREFEQLDKLNKKLENWHELTYAEFLKELQKKKIELSLSQKAEWEDYFLSEQKIAMDLQNQITSTDKEIDAMVYELYGLSEEEIAIVENK